MYFLLMIQIQKKFAKMMFQWTIFYPIFVLFVFQFDVAAISKKKIYIAVRKKNVGRNLKSLFLGIN